MLLRFLLISLFLCFSSVSHAQEEKKQQVSTTDFGGEGSEEEAITLLIQAQERSAKKLKDLLQYLGQYRAQEEKCFQNPDNLDELYKLSECALLVKQTIKESYVEPYFRQNFLDDLDKLSSTAEKRTPPPLTKS